MAVVPYTDGKYYVKNGLETGFLIPGLSPEEYSRRAAFSNGSGSSSDSNEAEGLSSQPLTITEIENNSTFARAQLIPLVQLPEKVSWSRSRALRSAEPLLSTKITMPST